MSNPTHQHLLVGMINAANPDYTWDEGQLVFGNPTETEGQSHNTSISVSANNGPTGSQTVHYNRVDLAIVGSGGLSYEADFDEMMTSQLLARISSSLGYEVYPDDIEDQGIEYAAEGPTQVTIQAAANSLAWFGSFSVELVVTPPAIEELITNTELDGLTSQDLVTPVP